MEWNLQLSFCLLLTLCLQVKAMSTPSLTRVSPDDITLQVEASNTHPHPQQETAASEDEKGFMEDIGFSHFFTDIGLQSSASNLGIGSSQSQQGFSLPHDFAGGSQVGGSHLGSDFGIGFAASNQHEQKTDDEVDPAVQGFIPANPLSFGGHLPSSSSFVTAKTSPLANPSAASRPTYKSPTHNPFAGSSRAQSNLSNPIYRPYDDHASEKQKFEELKHKDAGKTTKYRESLPASHSTAHFSKTYPHKNETLQKGPYQEESQTNSKHGSYKKPDYSHHNKDDEDFDNTNEKRHYGRRDPHKSKRNEFDYEDDFYNYYNDDEYRYAPTHQETRPQPQYNNEDQRDYPSQDNDSGYQSEENPQEYHDEEAKPSQQEEQLEHKEKPNEYKNSGRPSGYKHDSRPSGYKNIGRPSGYRNNGRPNGYRNNFRPSGYRNNGRPNRHPNEGYRGNGPRHQVNRPNYNNKQNKFRTRDHPRATERSESRPQHQYEQQDISRSGKEPCHTEERNGMTCEVCEDDDGGFSEHCAHSTRGGKDRTYANSRRGSHNKNGPDAGKKERSHTQPNPVYVPRPNKYSNKNYHGDRSGQEEDHSTYNNEPSKFGTRHPPRASERSESRPQQQYEKKQDTDKSGKEPCHTEERDGMICKVCEDDDGGYSEHCAHSTRRGKDRTYANSRRGSHNKNGPDAGKKESSQTRPNPVYVPRSGYDGKNEAPAHKTYQDNSYKPYNEDDYFGQYSTQSTHSAPYAQARKDSDIDNSFHLPDFGKHVDYDPYPEGSEYDPYTAETGYDVFDDVIIDFGHADHGHHHTAFGDDDDRGDDEHRHHHGHSDVLQRKDSKDVKKSETKKNEHQYPAPTQVEHFKPLDHEDNYAQLTKMMSSFEKKDRSTCKKVEKSGMTCFICLDSYGMEDEECLYANEDPNGHDIKYSEETSYRK